MAKVGKPRFHVDDKEFMKMLQAVGTEPIRAAGEAVASEVRKNVPDDVPVVVNHKRDRNGRPVALVTVAHASGLARQAKDGVLTKAAANAGLDVNRYGGD